MNDDLKRKKIMDSGFAPEHWTPEDGYELPEEKEEKKQEPKPAPVTLPEHAKAQKGPGIVVDKGPYKGTYDGESDLQHSVAQGEKKLKEASKDFFESNHPRKDLFEAWYGKLDENNKNTLREINELRGDKDVDAELEQFFEKPENKARILANMRKISPLYREMDDDYLWSQTSLKVKKDFFGK